MNYGEILGKSWKIFWKHKILWVIGILPYLFYSLIMIPVFVIPAFMFRPNPPEFLDQAWVWIVFGVSMLLFTLGYAVLMVWSKASGSLGILQADGGKERLSFGELVRQGGRYFWRVLGLYSLYAGAILVVELVIFGILTFVVIATFGMAMFCIFPFFILLIPVMGFSYLLVEQSNSAIFVEELGVIEALERGWNVLMKNFWKLVLMGLIVYVGSYVITMIATSPLYGFMFVPMMVPMMTNDMDAFVNSYSYMMIGMAILMPLLWIFTSILYTYVRVAWMLTFLSLTKPVQPTESAELVNA